MLTAEQLAELRSGREEGFETLPFMPVYVRDKETAAFHKEKAKLAASAQVKHTLPPNEAPRVSFSLPHRAQSPLPPRASSRDPNECFFCGEKGHRKLDCHHLNKALKEGILSIGMDRRHTYTPTGKELDMRDCRYLKDALDKAIADYDGSGKKSAPSTRAVTLGGDRKSVV